VLSDVYAHSTSLLYVWRKAFTLGVQHLTGAGVALPARAVTPADVPTRHFTLTELGAVYMAVMQGNTAILTATTVNVLAGQQYEFVPFDASVEFGLVMTVLGMLVSVFSATDLLLDSAPVVVKATAPVYPDDFMLHDVARKGDRLQIKANNPTGGTINLLWTVKLTPI
jgi:hypothetical protein